MHGHGSQWFSHKMNNRNQNCGSRLGAKGQLISKPIYDLPTSPKKRTDEFDLFAFLLFTANKSNSSIRFLGESTGRQSAFRIYLTFTALQYRNQITF